MMCELLVRVTTPRHDCDKGNNATTSVSCLPYADGAWRICSGSLCAGLNSSQPFLAELLVTQAVNEIVCIYGILRTWATASSDKLQGFGIDHASGIHALVHMVSLCASRNLAKI
eukprot:3111003-Amphidinium_carterae.1